MSSAALDSRLPMGRAPDWEGMSPPITGGSVQTGVRGVVAAECRGLAVVAEPLPATETARTEHVLTLGLLGQNWLLTWSRVVPGVRAS
jgi:hypothetical protein